MILPSTRPAPDDFLAGLPRWHRLLIRGRFLLAGVYLIALGLFVWAVFLDERFLGHIDADLRLASILGTVFFGMQALLLAGAPHFRWPRPTRRRWIGVSVVTAALMAALLTIGFVATLTSLLNQKVGWVESLGPLWTALTIVIGVPWLFWLGVFTLLWAGEWVGKFHRLFRLLVGGTCLELLITIPVDVAVRKRTQCYCDEGTFFSLAIGITMAFWTFGPGIVLLFFNIRGRAQRQLGMCVQCGYDLRGLPEPRCPECGTPFKPANPASA